MSGEEKNIERLLKQRVESAVPGARCLKFISPGCSGVPDRIIFLPGGTVLLVELKKPGETPRDRQLYVHNQFRKLGFVVYSCVDSPEWVNAVVARCLMEVRKAERRKRVKEDVQGI